MAEPPQDHPPKDVQTDDEIPDVSGHGPSTPPEAEAESKPETHPDPEAQNMVIESLRSQIQDLFSQVTQLNSKLVSSYDRVSHLEDQLHDSSNELRSASVKVSQLELERSQHLSALNSGLLVERTHVTAELTRLMEKATEEAARRGKAESARAEIEKELDDLSAGLFGQANTMVAEARLARAASERKVEETERALKGTEEAITNMQLHMQALQEEKEEALRQVEDMRITVGKGKWTRRDSSMPVTALRQILNCTSQYQDFLSFVAHIRELRQKSNILPLITTVNHAWLARLQLEDSWVYSKYTGYNSPDSSVIQGSHRSPRTFLFDQLDESKIGSPRHPTRPTRYRTSVIRNVPSGTRRLPIRDIWFRYWVQHYLWSLRGLHYARLFKIFHQYVPTPTQPSHEHLVFLIIHRSPKLKISNATAIPWRCSHADDDLHIQTCRGLIQYPATGQVPTYVSALHIGMVFEQIKDDLQLMGVRKDGDYGEGVGGSQSHY
jgi:hypothetical protein